ncbi:MAG TPA: endonuclease III [Actinomycetota bacterium]|nr:endonuclease III [Actinomycetota bacterium]
MSTRRVRAVYRRLVAQHGEGKPRQPQPIVDELVGTVLSQHTSDVNTERAFASLRARFGAWDDVADAPVDDVADAIRAGGLARIKAPRIQAILREIRGREGTIDLSRLDELDDADVDAYLRSLPGVGPKTAACVLTFSMGRAAFPVDTHVHRVTRRLGWIGERTSAEAAHDELTPRVPPELRYPLHMALIVHGRTICTARMPKCSACSVFDFCDAGPRLLASGDAR